MAFKVSHAGGEDHLRLGSRTWGVCVAQSRRWNTCSRPMIGNVILLLCRKLSTTCAAFHHSSYTILMEHLVYVTAIIAWKLFSGLDGELAGSSSGTTPKKRSFAPKQQHAVLTFSQINNYFQDSFRQI